MLNSLCLCVTVTPTDLELALHQENSLAVVKLDRSNTSQFSQASGLEWANDLSLLGDFSFSYDSDISIATTLVEGIMLQFPITQDFAGSISTTEVTSGHEGSKSVAYSPQIVSDLASDGPQRLDSNTLSEPIDVITMTEAARGCETHQERLKKLFERRFTHPHKMKPTYARGGR